MTEQTVADLAAELKRPASKLLEQLHEAGVAKASLDDALDEAEKKRLLDFLRIRNASTDGERKKITLVRKPISDGSLSPRRTIRVEVRKNRTFVSRDDITDADEEMADPSMDASSPRIKQKDRGLGRENGAEQSEYGNPPREQIDRMQVEGEIKVHSADLNFRFDTGVESEEYLEIEGIHQIIQSMCSSLKERRLRIEARPLPDLMQLFSE